MKTMFKPDIRKLVAAVTTAGLLVTGTAGVAYAADSGTDAPATNAPAAHGRRLIGAAVGVAADAIGIDRADLVKDVRDGKSVADIAKAHNVDPKSVVDALVAAGSKRVDTAVSNDRIDADRAAKIKEKLPQRAEKLVDGQLKGKLHRRVQRVKMRRHARRGGIKVAAETIGVSAQDLVTAIRGGSSVADVAKAHNVDPKTVVDAVVAAAGKKLDQAVANGKLDADRAAKIKDQLTARRHQGGRPHAEGPHQHRLLNPSAPRTPRPSPSGTSERCEARTSVRASARPGLDA